MISPDWRPTWLRECEDEMRRAEEVERKKDLKELTAYYSAMAKLRRRGYVRPIPFVATVSW